MKQFILSPVLVFFLSFPYTSFSQEGVFGKWVSIDDKSNEKKAIVEIYEKNGKVYGKIVFLYRKPGENPDPVCEACDKDDPRYKKKIIGMEVIQGLEKDGEEYVNGEVLDPKYGNIYDCKIWREGEKLIVRGYLFFFYRTQIWVRP